PRPVAGPRAAVLEDGAVVQTRLPRRAVAEDREPHLLVEHGGAELEDEALDSERSARAVVDLEAERPRVLPVPALRDVVEGGLGDRDARPGSVGPRRLEAPAGAHDGEAAAAEAPREHARL